MGQPEKTLVKKLLKFDAISTGKRLILCVFGLSVVVRNSDTDGRWVTRIAP
jgi:hypothetical protein